MTDWDDLKFVLAVAREGSLSAAARALHTTQPTVGRRVAALESRLGARLFHRTPSSAELTEIGRTLLSGLERIEGEILAVERKASGRDAGPSGIVSITAPEWFCAHVLAPSCAEISAVHPDISLELAGDARAANLVRRDADIAFRLRRFEHQEVIAQRLGRIGFGLYAAPGYLESHGIPSSQNGFAGHFVIAMQGDAGPVADLAWLTETAHAARIALRTDSREAQASAASAGLGLACLPHMLGDAIPALSRLDIPVPERELWMGVHVDMRALPRVEATSKLLVTHIQKRMAAQRK
ncbi:hypothetical protein AC629_02515 [Bradyrhizobium sp. NAS80.1]|nr:hypothetical protein AC629_02515 [Bradyrhizobium sp. NAS80.1]